MRVSFDGFDLDFIDQGHGPAVLLLHGFPLDRRIWLKQIEGLRGSHRVIAPDLRGHGQSSATPPGAYGMDAQAKDLLRLLDILRVESFVPVGHSMGGYIAFGLHRHAPGRIPGIAFVCSRAAADSEEARRSREETAERVTAEGVEFLAEAMAEKLVAPGAPKSVEDQVRDMVLQASVAGVTGALRGMASRPDATPQLERITVPALVVAGKGDKVVPAAESEALARGMPKGKLEWCEGSGHLPMLEEPGRLTTVLQEFLGGLKR